MNKLIRNIKIFGHQSYFFDLLILDGKVAEIAEDRHINSDRIAADDILDLDGCVASRGFVDMHVHFREPGQTDKETIETGVMAAAKGGFTTVVCMPNTVPPIDNADTLLEVDRKGRQAKLVRVLVAGALSKGQAGLELSDIEGMDAAETLSKELTGHGIAALTEDGKSLRDEALMERVCYEASKRGLLIMDHAEPEEEIIARDIELARKTGARFHIQHVSRKGSVELIRAAKASGVPITCETAPHYFSLTASDVGRLGEWGALAKMNPPLGTDEDRQAIIIGLLDDTIDVIATDHAPHELSLKALGYDAAPNGVSGLETAFSVSYTALVKSGYLTLEALVQKLCDVPERILGLTPPHASEFGKDLDLVLFDTTEEYEIDTEKFVSKGKNSPFGGKKVCGKVLLTICGGNVTYSAL
ncbi:MAG: dihydroorotase [Clostridiales Family XIII bacterium]|jgi:dihydroorotase|nr:dihydroorotase [Clostridiales Family XIII bacterium]